MIKRFPRAERYLEAEHWPTRQSWATPWVRTRFTADTRTTGRVESENSVNKLLGNRKTSLSDLFQSLVQRAAQQAQPSKLAAYLLQRETATESHCRDILDRLRAHCDIWVVKRAVAEMEHASFYEAKAVNLGDLPSISELVGENSGCQDKDAPVPPPVVKEDEVEDLNELPSDALGRAELDAAYLLEMLRSLGFNIVRGYQLRRITKLGARIVFVSTTAQLFCSCGTSIAAGVPCRHIWAVVLRGEWFSMGAIHSRRIVLDPILPRSGLRTWNYSFLSPSFLRRKHQRRFDSTHRGTQARLQTLL